MEKFADFMYYLLNVPFQEADKKVHRISGTFYFRYWDHI